MQDRKIEKILAEIVGESSISEKKSAVVDVNIASISPNRFQPRRTFDEKHIAELAASIRMHGLLQPLVVRRLSGAEPPRYELIAGERRLRALVRNGALTAPAILMDVNDAHLRTLAMIENIQRADLCFFDLMVSMEELKSEMGSSSAVAKALGKGVRTVERYLHIATAIGSNEELLSIFRKHAHEIDYTSADAFADFALTLNKLRTSDKREYARVIKRLTSCDIRQSLAWLKSRFARTPLTTSEKSPAKWYQACGNRVTIKLDFGQVEAQAPSERATYITTLQGIIDRIEAMPEVRG